MADPVTLALLGGGMAVKGLGALFGARSQRDAQKRAGTTLANMAEEEQKRALGFPDIINPYIEERYGQAAKGVSDVSGQSADTLEQRARQGYEDVMGQVGQANAYLSPYSSAGQGALSTLSQLANAPEERFNFQFSQDDPSYQFRVSEGEKALQKSAAARGGLMGGGTLKALSRYGQDMASQEYQNSFNRALSTFGANQSARQQRLGTLGSLAQMGYGASGQAGQNLIGGAQYGGTLTTNAAANAGGMRNAAALFGGNTLLNSTNMQSQNIIDANNIARQLRLQGGQATANSILGAGQAGSDMWGGLGNAIGGGLTLAGMAQGGYLGGQPSVGKVKVPNWVYTGQGMPGGSAPWGGYPGSGSGGLGGSGYEYMIPGLGF